MRKRNSPRLFLAAESLAAGNGGISRLARPRADQAFGGLGPARVCWLGTESDDLPVRSPDFGGRPTVVILGRLDPEPWKGHHALIDAWPGVVAAVPDARLLIVGVGPGL